MVSLDREVVVVVGVKQEELLALCKPCGTLQFKVEEVLIRHVGDRPHVVGDGGQAVTGVDGPHPLGVAAGQQGAQ